MALDGCGCLRQYLWGFVGDVSECLLGCVISVSVHVFVCIYISLPGLFWVSLGLYISESLGVCASQHS